MRRKDLLLFITVAIPIVALSILQLSYSFPLSSSSHNRRDHDDIAPSMSTRSSRDTTIAAAAAADSSSTRHLLEVAATDHAPVRKQKQQQRQQQQHPTKSYNNNASATTETAVVAEEEEVPVPPLHAILDLNNNDTIIGNPQPLLQWSIIGFGKCGTTTLQEYLNGLDPAIVSLKAERYDLIANKPSQLIRTLHEKLVEPYYTNVTAAKTTTDTASINAGQQQQSQQQQVLLRGYKCPSIIMNMNALRYYRELWPSTRLFVGIRHPLHWFQSLYNFRMQNLDTFKDMPHPNHLIGTNCTKQTCTSRGFFAKGLLQLGKQHYNTRNGQRGRRAATRLEKEIVGEIHPTRPAHVRNNEYMPNPVFIYDIQQLSDTNITRKTRFRNDVLQFLGLNNGQQSEQQPQDHPTSEEVEQHTTQTRIKIKMPHVKPGREWPRRIQVEKDEMKIKNICNDEYLPVRRELLRMAKLSSLWIRQTFLKLPKGEVYCSSPDYLEQLLESWMYDPCR